MYAWTRAEPSLRRSSGRALRTSRTRVITANRAPDHSTIAEFRVRHEQALGDLFGGVLEWCKQAGLVSVGVIAVDGTNKVANASSYANVDYRRIAREILEEAARASIARQGLSSTVRRAAMSCPSICAPLRVAGRL